MDLVLKKTEKLTSEKIRDIFVWVIVLFFMVALVFPLFFLGIKSLENTAGEYVGVQNFVQYLKNPGVMNSFLNTVKIAILSMVITLGIGFLYSYGVSRANLKGKNILKFLVLLPIFAPTMLHGISLVYLFGRMGLITTGFFGRLPWLSTNINLYGPVGIVISEVIYTLPQAYLIISIALANSDYRLYEAAETLGTSKIKQFFTITLPGCKYAVFSTSIVAFILAFTDFGAPKVVGGDYNVLATDIYKQVIGQQNLGRGAVVSILLLIPAVISFFLQKSLEKKQRDVFNAKSMGYRIKESVGRDIFFNIFCWIIAFFILGIFLTAIVASFIKMWPYNFEVTLNNYKFFDFNGGAMSFYRNSVSIAIASGFIGTFLAYMGAFLYLKTESLKLLRNLINFFAIVPLALPGMVLGLGYIFFFNMNLIKIPFIGEISNPFNSLYGTMWILVLVNITHFFSVAFMTAATSLKKLDKEFEIISLSMGVPWYKTFFHVTLPLTIGAVGEIFMYYFVNSMTTVSAAVFLYSSKTTLASIAMVNLDEVGDQAKAAAMGILIIGTNLIIKLIYEIIKKFFGRK
ncbi:MAG: putative 2-aminoethylphosphonate ABC transporter permease subunit [Fusobacteriaceae bacterium]